jgi:hypothetical protein
MKMNIEYIICAILVSFFIVSSAIGIEVKSSYLSDFDPLTDVEVTVEIQKIRAFDKDDPQVRAEEYIDLTSDPDFYVKIIINDQEFTSDTWHDTKYIYEPQFSATLDVPDDEEFVTVKIQLWDWNDNGDVLCDVGDENDDVELSYSIKTGHWTGDDQLEDPSGYGRLNGCDDGSIYKRDLDCELWFDIYQNDYDGDGVPYWTEVNDYGTDPEVDNTNDDIDGDDIPLKWEWKWGYDPLEADDHRNIDPEEDGIDNYEEYITSEWFSDPYRIDLFIELDQMEQSPEGEECLLPEGSKELLYTAYDRQNVVFHLDDGSWGEQSGSDFIPFDSLTECSWWEYDELDQIYNEYFLHGDPDNWRRGVFHYGVVIYQSSQVHGNMFGPNRFQISAHGMEWKQGQFPFLHLQRDIVYASAYMHECGHTFNFRPIPGHNKASYYPWQIGWWLARPYKSCMNYGYMYTAVDYSDGSRPFGDYDDWERMDLTFFQEDW